MKLESIEQIVNGMCVFMPSGIEAEISMDAEGNIYVKYSNNCTDTYSQDEFGNLIEDGVEVLTPMSIANQSVLMENLEKNTENEKLLIKKLKSFVGIKETGDDIEGTYFKNKDNTLTIHDGTDTVTIQDNKNPKKQRQFSISTEEKLEKLINIAKGVFDMPIMYECELCDMERLQRIARTCKDVKVRQEATTLLDNINLGLYDKDTVAKFLKKNKFEENYSGEFAVVLRDEATDTIVGYYEYDNLKEAREAYNNLKSKPELVTLEQKKGNGYNIITSNLRYWESYKKNEEFDKPKRYKMGINSVLDQLVGYDVDIVDYRLNGDTFIIEYSEDGDTVEKFKITNKELEDRLGVKDLVWKKDEDGSLDRISYIREAYNKNESLNENNWQRFDSDEDELEQENNRPSRYYYGETRDGVKLLVKGKDSEEVIKKAKAKGYNYFIPDVTYSSVDKCNRKYDKLIESINEEVEETKNYKRTRLANPNTCKKDSFRTKTVNKKGDKIVLCKDKETGKMKAQSKLDKKENYKGDIMNRRLRSLTEKLTWFINEINDEPVDNTYSKRVDKFSDDKKTEDELFKKYAECREAFKKCSALDDGDEFDKAKEAMWEAFKAWFEALQKVTDPKELKKNIELTVSREFRKVDNKKNESLNGLNGYKRLYKDLEEFKQDIAKSLPVDSNDIIDKIDDLLYIIRIMWDGEKFGSSNKNESLNEGQQYGVEYRNMHDGIHRLLVTNSKEKAEQILAYLKELENPDTTVYDDNEIMDNAYFTWDEINKLADDCFEVDYREIEEGDGNYNGIYIINYNEVKPDIYESLNEDNEEDMLTDINDLDFPDALADTVETNDEGELLTLGSVVDEIKDMKDEIIDAVNDVKDEIQFLDDTEVTDKDIEELQDEIDAQSTEDTDTDDNTEDTEIENENNEDNEEEMEESFKKYLRKGQYENLSQTKQEIDKAVRNGEDVKDIKNDIVLKSEDEKEEEQAKEYAAQKLKESLLNTKYTSKIQL